MWMLQFDDDTKQIARKLWNKYGFILKDVVLSISHENSHRNLFYYLRTPNTSIFETTVKAITGAMELFQYKFDLILDDLLEFYDSEIKIIEELAVKAAA